MDYEKVKIEMGQRLHEIMYALNIKPKELAEMAHISVHFVYDLLGGKKGVSLDVIADVAKALNTTLDYLILGDTLEPTIGEDTRILIETVPADERPLLNEIIRAYALHYKK